MTTGWLGAEQEAANRLGACRRKGRGLIGLLGFRLHPIGTQAWWFSRLVSFRAGRALVLWLLNCRRPSRPLAWQSMLKPRVPRVRRGR
jgi:hypothetical protein